MSNKQEIQAKVIHALSCRGVEIPSVKDVKFSNNLVSINGKEVCRYAVIDNTVALSMLFSYDKYEAQPSIEALCSDPSLEIYPSTPLNYGIFYIFKEEDGYGKEFYDYIRNKFLKASVSSGYNPLFGNYYDITVAIPINVPSVISFFNSKNFRDEFIIPQHQRMMEKKDAVIKPFIKGVLAGIAISYSAVESYTLIDAVMKDQEVDLEELINQGRIGRHSALTLTTLVDTAMTEFKIDSDRWKRILKIKNINNG